MRPRRYRLIAASLVVHAAVVIALFITGFWKLDRLDGPRHRVDIVQGPPPPAPAGGPEVAKAEPFKQKQQRKVPNELRQPKIVEDDKAKPASDVTSTTPGTGSGSGPGSGSGDPNSKSDCTEDCGPDDAKPPEPEPKPPVVEAPVPVIPSVIRGMRTFGETQIQPPDNEKTSLLRSGKSTAIATAKVCVGATGSVTSLAMYKGSGYAGWDAAIMAAMRNWRYKPHQIDGRAVMVCGMVTFVYSIK